jgi:hypothetical protein
MSKQYFQLATALSLVLLLSGCCGKGVAYWAEQEVDITPLYDIELNLQDAKTISDVIDTSIFDRMEAPITDTTLLATITDNWTELQPNSSVSVLISLRPDVNSAQNGFNSACGTMSEISREVEFGGEKGNQYCITPIGQQMYSSDTPFCRPTGDYLSNVVFQKNRLIIFISERMYSENGKGFVSSKDVVIRRLAEELTK